MRKKPPTPPYRNLKNLACFGASVSVGMSTIRNICKGMQNVEKETVFIKDAAKEIFGIIEKNKNKHIIVKCDCEGAELEIFERLNEENIISKIDVIMMEYHFEKPDRLINIFTKNDFAVQVKFGYGKSKIGYLYAVRIGKKH